MSSSNCPISKSARSESKCPIDHSKPTTANILANKAGNSSQKVDSSEISELPLNPNNQMPNLPQKMHVEQNIALSTDREVSTIPRNKELESSDSMLQNTDHELEFWEYPSPQQFYNALMRKGEGVHEGYIDTMVQIHNFLNEGAWEEVLNWEKMHSVPRPFDRHDWYVDRCGKQVRYIIDYYDAPSEDGNPVFSLDVRPALDSFESLVDRVKMLFLKKQE
ncbi:hypothetical protein BB560_000986 [Smittium megazygosporum]|uniref:Holocytochrome c-type synthase n=1 Tax=Smittium megazygosporum TaxID=133381 RepID=A0A2T9ZIU9_9FUNG|nr:hypothetical protein BB560_000986 [Smittium megazygosporum]